MATPFRLTWKKMLLMLLPGFIGVYSCDNAKPYAKEGLPIAETQPQSGNSGGSSAEIRPDTVVLPLFSIFIDSVQREIRKSDSIPYVSLMHFPFAYAYEGFIDRSRFPAIKEEILPEMFKEGFLAANPDDFEEVELPASLHTAQLSSSKGYRFMIHVTHGEGEDMTESSLIYYFAWIYRRYKLVGMEIAG